MSFVSPFQGIPVLARTTFIQLVRMKVFLFLFFFLLILLGANTFRFSEFLGPETAGEQELTLLKNSTLGIMRLFGLVFSVTATALLIPKDAEDRILYTLLCRPLPRWQYLTGKLLGVMSVIIVVMGIMDLLFTGLLDWRTTSLIAEQQEILTRTAIAPETIQIILDRIAAQGATWNLQLGIGVLIAECLVLSAMTLLLSIISTSTLFSIVMGFSVYFIGLFQTDIQSMWFGADGVARGWLSQLGGGAISLIFPNFRVFALVDSAIDGKIIPLTLFLKVCLVAIAYMVLYLSTASFIFRKKEF